MSDAKKAAENKYVLLRPIEFEEKKYDSLEFDFDSLGGKDLVVAEKLAERHGGYDPGFLRPMNMVYQASVAAMAAKVPLDLIFELKAQDFTEVTLRAQTFLLAMG